MRTPIIAGNWKMHKTMAEAESFINVVNGLEVDGVEAVICAPYTDLIVLRGLLNDNIKIGSQNIHWEDKGAFTGEISPAMLKELGVKYSIVGHSERREMFGETDETVNLRVHAAFNNDIIPIVCVGEKLDERETGKTKDVVKTQVEKAIVNLSQSQIEQLVIAYEPIWAIGTGKTSSAEDANEVIGYIRSVVADQYNSDVASKVRIQYGGSVKPENIGSFMKQPEIDGALVGGASLEPESFIALVKGAK